MSEIIGTVVSIIKNFILNHNPVLGFLTGILVIILESMIPILPLAVFIALNILVFGNYLGYAMSLFATIIGCIIAFFIFRNKVHLPLYDKLIKLETMQNIQAKMNKISLSNLVFIMSLPFTPAFAINIAAGISKISFKKFFIALLFGKAIMVYWWAFVGTTLIESISNPVIIIKLILLVLCAYLFSYYINSRYQIK